MSVYTPKQYRTDLKKILSEEIRDENITARIKPLAEKLAADGSWFKQEYRTIDQSQGFGLHLLFEDENHDLAAFVIAWAPGNGLSAHNHKTWAVVRGIEGQEEETNYRRLDDGSRAGFAELERTHVETLYPGNAVCCMPEDIHSVWNNGDTIAVSLHTYGHHLNHTGRSIFNVEEKTEKPCIVNVQE